MRIAQARMALRPDGLPRVADDDPMLNQGELADLVGIHRVTMTRIEGGNARVSLDVLERLSAVLGRSREWFLGEPEAIDPFELARDKMTSALHEFSEAVDLLQRAARDAGQPGQVPV